MEWENLNPEAAASNSALGTNPTHSMGFYHPKEQQPHCPATSQGLRGDDTFPGVGDPTNPSLSCPSQVGG